MNERFIAVTKGGLYGYWAGGATLEEAVKGLRKAGAKKRAPYRVYKFTSELPFAPAKREATEGEADCWIGQDGSCNWIRCEREEIEAAHGG